MDLISNLMVKPLVYFPRKKIWFEGPMDFFNIDLDQMSNSCSEQSEAFSNWLDKIAVKYRVGLVKVNGQFLNLGRLLKLIFFGTKRALN